MEHKENITASSNMSGAFLHRMLILPTKFPVESAKSCQNAAKKPHT